MVKRLIDLKAVEKILEKIAGFASVKLTADDVTYNVRTKVVRVKKPVFVIGKQGGK
jgi:hypothetical protein